MAEFKYPLRTLTRTDDFVEDKIYNENEMRQGGILTDFVINIEGKQIKCHRYALASASPYFRSMFQHVFSEVQNGFVNLEGMKAQAVADVVDYCYRGGIHLSSNNSDFLHVVKVAHHFQLRDLIDRIDHEFGTLSAYPDSLKMNSDACLELYRCAKKYGMNLLEKKAEELVRSKFPEVKKCAEFCYLNFTEVVAILEMASRYYDSDMILATLIDWIKYKEDERSPYFSEFTKKFKLDKCSAAVLRKLVLEEKSLLLANPEFHMYITERLIQNMQEDVKPSVKPVHESSEVEPVAEKSFGSLKVMILGGRTVDNTLQKQGFKIDLATGEKVLFDISPLRNLSVICTTPFGIFVAGGIDPSTSSAFLACSLLSVDQMKWQTMSSLSNAVYGGGAVCIDMKVFLIATVGGGPPNRLEAFDLVTHKFSKCPDMLQTVKFPIVASSGKCIYVLFNTAFINKEYKKGKKITLQCYDTSRNLWQFCKPLPKSVTNTEGASVCSSGECLYVVGGMARLLLGYHIENNVWTELTQPSLAHNNGFTLVQDGTIYACGGKDKDTVTDLIECYDIENGDWELCPFKLPCPMSHAFCSKIG